MQRQNEVKIHEVGPPTLKKKNNFL